MKLLIQIKPIKQIENENDIAENLIKTYILDLVKKFDLLNYCPSRIPEIEENEEKYEEDLDGKETVDVQK